MNHPPKILEKVFRFVSLDSEVEDLSGDFHEQFNYLAKVESYSRAVIWYAFQILKLIIPNLIFSTLIGAVMIKNYILIAFRNLLKHKNYSFINIFGLAVGLACFVLISFFVLDELSYDNYHEKADRIYRIGIEEYTPSSREYYAMTPEIMAPTMKDEFPEVADATRMSSSRAMTVKYQDKQHDETRIVSVDPSFLKIFTIPFLDGDPNSALDNPKCVLLTKTMAKKYFHDDDPMGELIFLGETEYEVSGIIEDIPLNSHLNYDFLISRTFTRTNWGAFSVYTYIEFTPDANIDEFKAKLPNFYIKHVGPRYDDFEEFRAQGNGMIFIAEALRDLHLKSIMRWTSKPGGNYNSVIMFGIISIFILLIACINFMNISTARSVGRAKEVGVRKVLGSYRKQLVFQFLIESLLSSFFAMAIAVLLLLIAEPYFNSISGKEFSILALPLHYLIPGMIFLPAVIGIFAGSYPAFYLSSFRPISVLKDRVSGTISNSAIRNGLVIFQFCVSIALIIGTFTINDQKDYMLNKYLGFEKDKILVVERARTIVSKLETFKEALIAYPEIQNVSNSQAVPGDGYADLFFTVENRIPEQQYNLAVVVSDKDLIETYGLEIVEGRNFSKELLSDSTGIIINEAAYKLLGFNDIENKNISWGGDDMFSVIGVVKDFHFKSLHREIAPFVYLLGNGGLLSIKFRTDDDAELLENVKKEWDKVSAGQPFKYHFLDDSYAKLYESEIKSSELFTLFSVLALFIGCLGLIGLVSFSAEQRTKEIGIRKVLGASESELLLMLSKDFVKLVLAAFVLVSPFVFYGIIKWLEGYAYRIDFPYLNFFYAGTMILVITLLTISYQALKSAYANPIDSLKYDE